MVVNYPAILSPFTAARANCHRHTTGAQSRASLNSAGSAQSFLFCLGLGTMHEILLCKISDETL
jgi:hypothetical protein